MKLKSLFFILLFCSLGYTQNKGTLSGIISDKDNNNLPLAIANISIKGTTIGTSTDQDGKYSFSLNAGKYTLVIRFLGYDSAEVPVTVVANETTTVNKTLGSSSVKLSDIVIKGSRRKNTEAALMSEIKAAKQVVSAISAEQIAKSTDNNAAQAIQRVPGVTIVDGRFIMIRGLNERYNNVLINNAIAPSTEVDRRTFAFDLIPASSLDKMVIYKTGSADKPGDFSGGIISITTSENSAEFTKVDLSFGYRTGTSFGDYQQTEGSGTDFLGFDNGFRALPNRFPTGAVINGNPQFSAAASNALPNNFNPTSSTAFLDNSFGFSFGRNIKLGGTKKLFTTNIISYSNSFQTINRDFNRYLKLGAGKTTPDDWLQYKDNIFTNENRVTVLSNWIFRFGQNNKIKFKNLFNQIGENSTTIRNGFNFLQRGKDDLRSYALGYTARTIYLGQLEGEHKFGEKSDVAWVLGFNNIIENEPDLRRFRTFRPAAMPTSPYIMIDPPSSNLFDTGRYYGKLNEYSANGGLNYTYTIPRIKNDEELESFKIKAGTYFDYRARDFASRYVSYLIPGYVPFARAEELRRLPLTTIFSPQNVNATDGWVLREGTRPIDSYKAFNTLIAGYLMAELPIGKFDITVGVRAENNIQELKANDDAGKIGVKNPVLSVLPSLNVGYNFSEKSLLRLAYSRSVNRPEFREIAPFLFYDYENDAARVGNPNLKTANIDNIDVRYEFYPTKGETISLGAFYKNFTNPIENVTIITTEQPQFAYANASNAFNYGLETEIRKSFKGLFNNTFTDRLTLNMNASYIFSNVDLGSSVTSQAQTRALQGQSPYIINVALGYTDEKDFSVNVIFNRFGDRIFSVGDIVFPTIYELSRNSLDFTVSKKIKNTKFKLGVQDALNAAFRFYEDTNRDEKINIGQDFATSVFKRGSLISLNISHNF
jgi:outer membrane receptor protein involved in Fe transport